MWLFCGYQVTPTFQVEGFTLCDLLKASTWSRVQTPGGRQMNCKGHVQSRPIRFLLLQWRRLRTTLCGHYCGMST